MAGRRSRTLVPARRTAGRAVPGAGAGQAGGGVPVSRTIEIRAGSPVLVVAPEGAQSLAANRVWTVDVDPALLAVAKPDALSGVAAAQGEGALADRVVVAFDVPPEEADEGQGEPPTAAAVYLSHAGRAVLAHAVLPADVAAARAAEAASIEVRPPVLGVGAHVVTVVPRRDGVAGPATELAVDVVAPAPGSGPYALPDVEDLVRQPSSGLFNLFWTPPGDARVRYVSVEVFADTPDGVVSRLVPLGLSSTFAWRPELDKRHDDHWFEVLPAAPASPAFVAATNRPLAVFDEGGAVLRDPQTGFPILADSP